MQTLSSHFIQRNNMSQDHLYEEGPAELEDFEVPSIIIFFIFVFLTLPYMIHFNRHFHIYGIIARLSGYIEFGPWFTMRYSFGIHFIFLS